MVFNEIDNFIEVYNNSVIELIQCFGTSFFGRIDHLASSVIKFRPKNSVPKHSIRSITYNYCSMLNERKLAFKYYSSSWSFIAFSHCWRDAIWPIRPDLRSRMVL